MKTYGRRDFLKALGIGAAALTIAPVDRLRLPAVGGRIAFEIDAIFPEYFPWEFHGETELPARISNHEHADLIALQTEEPPEGYAFFARGLRFGLREDVTAADMRNFLEIWSVSLKSGPAQLISASGIVLYSGWGVGSGPLPLVLQLALPPNQPLQLSFHGKPFPLTGPLVVHASVYGVGMKVRTANDKAMLSMKPPVGKQK